MLLPCRGAAAERKAAASSDGEGQQRQAEPQRDTVAILRRWAGWPVGATADAGARVWDIIFLNLQRARYDERKLLRALHDRLAKNGDRHLCRRRGAREGKDDLSATQVQRT